MADAVETEWQFEADDLDQVASWLAAQPAHAPLTFALSRDRLQVDEYYDTADWRLYLAGFSLRRRQGGESAEFTLKGLARTETRGATSRREISQASIQSELRPLIEGGVPGPVLDRVRVIAGGHPVAPLFEVRTRRRTHEVRRAGSRVAVVELDETSVVPPSGDPTTLLRVEVELEGRLSRLVTIEIESFVTAMARSCGLRPATASKFESGLEASGLDPAGALDFGSTERDPEGGAVEYAYAWLREHWASFLRHEPATRLGEDIEALHQMRVATRRLRATLGLFGDLLSPAMAHARDELQWVGHDLGVVRDLDVQIEGLERLRAKVGWEDAAALAPLVEVIEQERERERAHLLGLLGSERYDALVHDFSEALRAGPPDAPSLDGVVDVVDYGVPVVRERFRKVRRDGRALTPDSPAEAYHALRIRGKRFRYSLELFGELYGRPAERMTDAVKAFQDLLGEHQDAEVARDRLRALVTAHRGLPPETLVAIGELRERYRNDAAEKRRAFPATFRTVLHAARALERALAARPRPASPPPLPVPVAPIPGLAPLPSLPPTLSAPEPVAPPVEQALAAPEPHSVPRPEPESTVSEPAIDLPLAVDPPQPWVTPAPTGPASPTPPPARSNAPRPEEGAPLSRMRHLFHRD